MIGRTSGPSNNTVKRVGGGANTAQKLVQLNFYTNGSAEEQEPEFDGDDINCTSPDIDM